MNTSVMLINTQTDGAVPALAVMSGSGDKLEITIPSVSLTVQINKEDLAGVLWTDDGK